MFDRKLTVTRALIIINIVVFVVGMMVQRPADLGLTTPQGEPTSVLQIIGAFSFFTCFTEGQIWRLITYQFLHANLMHLLFNMWALMFFGPAVEAEFGPKKFLGFYLLCGVAGALFSSLLAGMGIYTTIAATPHNMIYVNMLAAYHGYSGTVQPWQMLPMVGASASIYGVLVATAVLYPRARVSLLFPPVTLTLRTLALVVIGIATLIILSNGDNAGGEAGHLGGVIMGALVMVYWKFRHRSGVYYY